MPFVTLNKNQIFYETNGSGSPLLLLHNGFYSSDTWLGVRDELAQHYTVITYDQTGYGRSTHFEYGIDGDIVEFGVTELTGLINHLGFEKVNLLGHCLGGAIALLFTSRNPDRINKTIAESVGYSGNYKSLFKTDMTFVAWDKIPETLRTMLISMHGKEYALKFWDILSNYKDSYIMSENYDIRKEVRKIRTPLFIINGDRDFYFEPEIPVSIYHHMKNARLWIAPLCGHDMHIEQRDDFVREVLRFLGE